jgi:hypothetical protein
MATLIEAEYLLRRLSAARGSRTRWGNKHHHSLALTGEKLGIYRAERIVREEIAKEKP